MAGGYYHVVSRGVERRAIFLDDRDRAEFVGLLERVVVARAWSCLAFCLMGNHYHLVVKTPEADLADGMQEINGRYAQDFNDRHRRDGHLFQGRYASLRIRREVHLLAAVRYVVRNPVQAGLCDDATEWQWSSHRTVLWMPMFRFVAVAELLALFAASFGGDPGSRAVYARFVDGMSRRSDVTTWTPGNAYDPALRTAGAPVQRETPEAVISVGGWKP